MPLNSDAVLDLSNTGTTGNNKGFLYPTVQLVSTILASPLTNMTAGMAVYNLLAAGSGATAVVPGMYLNNGTMWVLFSAAPTSAATFAAGSLNSYAGPSGSYIYNIPMVASNTQVVGVTVATAGTYTATSNVLNGVSFSASGTFSNVGANMVILTASGTPVASAAGIYTYALTLGGQTCSFNVTYYSAVAIFNSSTLAQSPAGPLVANTSYSSGSSITIPYTNGNGSSYLFNSQTISGLTLTRPPGTYSTSGSVVYNLTGTWTGTTDYATFTLAEGGTAIFGDNIHAALSTSQTAYTNAAANNWVAITNAEYANIASIIKGTVKYLSTDANLVSSGTTSTTAAYTYSNSNYNYINGSTYLIAVAIRGNPTTAPSTMAGIQLKYSNYGSNAQFNNFPAPATGLSTTPTDPPAFLPLTAATTYCYVLKSPTGTMAGYSYFAAYLPNPYQGCLISGGGYSGSGNVNTLPNNTAFAPNIQVLATPIKSW